MAVNDTSRLEEQILQLPIDDQLRIANSILEKAKSNNKLKKTAEKVLLYLKLRGGQVNFISGTKARRNLEHIIARLKEGFSANEMLLVVERCANNTYIVANNYFRPSTIFCRSNFHKYINETEIEKYQSHVDENLLEFGIEL